MKTVSHFFLAAAVGAFPVACDNPTGLPRGGTACTDLAAVSVSGTTVDLDGNPTHATSVDYTIDDAESRQAQCLDLDCSEWMAGIEQVGTFVVTATLDEPDPTDMRCRFSSSATATVEVVMEESGCHVAGQIMELVLDPNHEVCE